MELIPIATSLQLIDEAVESEAMIQTRGSAHLEFFPYRSLSASPPPFRRTTAIPAEVSSMFAGHPGTTGNFSLCKAANASASSFRCAFTSSGGVRASHWFSDTSA